MSEEPDESIQLEQVKEVAPKPKRVYKKKTLDTDASMRHLANPPQISPVSSPPPAEPSPISNDTPVATPVIKEKKARTQKQIDAFNKMREAYLNKHKTPVIEPSPPVIEPSPPVSNDSPKGMTQHVSVKEEPYELGTKKVQKPRAKKNKQVELNQEVNESPPVTQNVPANQVINTSPSPPPVAIPKVSTAPRFVFV